MKFVIQRVCRASVTVQKEKIAEVQEGLLVLIGIQKGDSEEEAIWMINKVLKMRIFEDENGKMNKSVCDIKGSLLLVPNFTLYADASKGNRPGFTEAESPGKARKLYDKLVDLLKNATDLQVETGRFGADMNVELVNGGPVTIILEKERDN